MQIPAFHTLAIGVILASGVISGALAGSLEASVTGARNDAGVIRCGLFASADGFRTPGREIAEAVGKIQRGRATCAFGTVPAGTFAIAVFHAERNEKRLDIGLLGQPKQGVGFSRNPSITFGAPSFSSASFTIGSELVNLQIEMKY